MTSNYGFVCRKCGGWYHSADRVKVSTVRKDHRKHGCTFITGKDGILRRPGLEGGGLPVGDLGNIKRRFLKTQGS
jgi:hypothetical protein